jgi:hypothetical protein
MGMVTGYDHGGSDGRDSWLLQRSIVLLRFRLGSGPCGFLHGGSAKEGERREESEIQSR